VQNQVGGVFAAVPTPFGVTGEPITDLFLEHCEWALANGCDGLNVLGSTGEANSQQRQSRELVMRTIAESNSGRGALMVGTGTPSLHETRDLTRLAADLKFDAVLILPPYYYKPLSNDALFYYFTKVIEVVSSTEIGVYLYNFPQLTGITFPQDVVERLIEAFPNHVRGMKDSSGDMSYAHNMATTFRGTFDVFPSSETCLAEGREMGYAGCISASVNATLELASKIWHERDTATAQEIAELQRLRKDIASVPVVSAVKTLVAMRTGRQEWLTMMPPLMALTNSERKVIDSVAERLGYKMRAAGQE